MPALCVPVAGAPRARPNSRAAKSAIASSVAPAARHAASGRSRAAAASRPGSRPRARRSARARRCRMVVLALDDQHRHAHMRELRLHVEPPRKSGIEPGVVPAAERDIDVARDSAPAARAGRRLVAALSLRRSPQARRPRRRNAAPSATRPRTRKSCAAPA